MSIPMPQRAPRALILLFTVAIAGCGTGTEEPTDDGGAPQSFIAFAGDFKGFRSWQSYSYSSDGGSIHNSGPRTEYINQLPPPGSTSFPVGTIIIKDIVSQRPDFFAMVKRSATYDPGGAKGWEWFDLIDNGDGQTVTINWRGYGPRLGESYGGDPTACNVCHRAATANDSVLSPKIRLSEIH